MSATPQSWTVTLELLSEGEVDLRATLNGDEATQTMRRCSIQEALRELEVLFACTGEADFFLAVRSPQEPWCHLATRRWRLALYFVTAQYERAFVATRRARGDGHEQAAVHGDAGARLEPLHDVPPFVEESGLVSALPAQAESAARSDRKG